MPGRRVAKEDPSRSYTTLELRNEAPLSRKYSPMRFPPNTIPSVPSPLARSDAIHACAIALSGSRVTNSVGIPKLASDTATLASLPPYVAMNSLVWEKRRKSGAVRRSITSPNVTTLRFVEIIFLSIASFKSKTAFTTGFFTGV